MTDATPGTQPATTLLEGILEDGEGRPLAGASVSLAGGAEDATTGPDGTFRVPAPPDRSTATVVVQERGRTWKMALPEATSSRARVVLAAPDSLPLRVLTPGTSPIPVRFGWTALVRTDEGLREGPSGEAAAPRFLARGLEPGTYAMVVWGGPFLPAVVEPVTLDGARGPALLSVELTRRGAAVAGRIVAPNGSPRVGVAVVATPVDGSLPVPARRALCRSDAGGRYRIEGLPWGTYVLVVDVGFGAPKEFRVALLDREERSLDVGA